MPAEMIHPVVRSIHQRLGYTFRHCPLLRWLESKNHHINRVERPTVVYVMSPDCRWCGYNMRNIKSLALARSGEYRFIGVSPPHPDLARYAELNKLPFPIFQIASLDAVPNLLLGQTPETIVIDKHGNVIADWNGAYAGDQQKFVEYFGLRLPGLLK